MLRTRSFVAPLFFLALASCTKTEPPAVKDADAGAPAAPSASASATTATAAEDAAPSASASAATDTAAPASASAATAGSAAAPAKDGGASAAANPSGEGVCGKKPLPDCPLQAWMKSNANPPVMANDAAGLAVAFDKISRLAPSGYTNWASIAKDGAKAARAGDVPGAKASCRTCHDQYKAKYKSELRTRKI